MAQPKIKYHFCIIQLITSTLSLSLCSPAFCGSLLKENALEYRQQGYDAQKAGMLPEALSFYQKAIQLDPSSAPVYNDLGVVYEMLGEPANAEQAYLRAVSLDPAYAKAYFNLAQVYEGKGNVLGAAEYWIKLLRVSDRVDPMVKKAENRIYEIGKIFPEVRRKYLETQVSLLTKDVIHLKQMIASDDKALAQYYIENAKAFAKKRNYLRALKTYLDAKQLDPQNDQLDGLIEETQRKLLLQ